MNFFEDVRQLGDAIRGDFRGLHYNSRDLPEIAQRRLRESELRFEFDLAAITRNVLDTTVPQSIASLAFSDLPSVLYYCPEFYIELLVWTSSTTTIHQHAFSGAFKVLHGSSFHSKWRFLEDRRLNVHTLLGQCRLDDAEVLSTGDVRPIVAGRDGLTHALYHLDHPSATLVIRTHSDIEAKPQYTLLPPCLAHNQAGLAKDPIVRIMVSTLDAAAGQGTEAVFEVFEEMCGQLDFSSLLQVVIERRAMMNSNIDRVEAAIRAVHGDLADVILPVLAQLDRRGAIARTRGAVKDADLRFFLALLMNVPNREWLLKVLSDHYPDRDASAFCVDALTALCDAESAAAAFMRLAEEAKIGTNSFATRFRSALPPGADGDGIQPLLQNLVAGRMIDGDTTQRMRRLPELSVFLD